MCTIMDYLTHLYVLIMSCLSIPYTSLHHVMVVTACSMDHTAEVIVGASLVLFALVRKNHIARMLLSHLRSHGYPTMAVMMCESYMEVHQDSSWNCRPKPFYKMECMFDRKV